MKHDNEWLWANMPELDKIEHKQQRMSDARMFAIFYAERMLKPYKKRIKELEQSTKEIEAP